MVQLSQRGAGGAGQSGVSGGRRKSSAIPFSAGSCRTGLHAEKMLSGTTMVRVQLDMAYRLKYNQRGSNIISGGTEAQLP